MPCLAKLTVLHIAGSLENLSPFVSFQRSGMAAHHHIHESGTLEVRVVKGMNLLPMEMYIEVVHMHIVLLK